MINMIGKLEFPHLLSPSKVNRKDQEEKAGNGSDSHKKDSSDQNTKDQESNDTNVISFKELQEIIDAINNSPYYEAKKINFVIATKSSGELHVLAKTKEGKIIQDLTPLGAKRIFSLIKINKSGKPVKGGLLNVAC